MKQEEIAKKTESLKEYFEQNPSVVIAFVFGSIARGFSGEDSDFDVAVYLKNRDKENEVWRNISRIVESEVDLVQLNDAPATLISNIFKTGAPLIIKDRKLYWELYLNTTSEAEDFAGFAEDYWRIYKRSFSLIPEDKTRLIERIQFLKTEFQDLDKFKKLTFEEYKEDKTNRRNIERWVENICNATLDVAKIILASEKKLMPKTYESALTDFGSLVEFSEEEIETFASFARLRNILAHEYMNILYAKIRHFI